MNAKSKVNAHRVGSNAERGFTLIELLVAALIGTLIIGGAYSAVRSQSELFRTQTELAEARTTLRAATALLSGTLMEAAADDSDISAISDSSFTIRQYHVSGTVCSQVTAGIQKHFGLQELRGDLPGGVTAGDSVVVYDIFEDEWNTAALADMWTGTNAWAVAGGNTPVCFWGDSTTAAPRPQAAVRLDAATPLLAAIESSVEVGAPLRIFRSTEYGVFQRDGAWWLGRRVAGATSWELLTGPLVPPVHGGIELSYYKSDGTTATAGSEVAAVELFLWSRGGQTEMDPLDADPPGHDSVRVRIHLRNNVG